jgi:hypothetical protein
MDRHAIAFITREQDPRPDLAVRLRRGSMEPALDLSTIVLSILGQLC